MVALAPETSIVACGSALPGEVAVIRLSGVDAHAIALRAGLCVGEPWQVLEQRWQGCPLRICFAAGPRSFTGYDLIEITLPGSELVVAWALEHLCAAGAEAAPPGGFTRQAVASGRMRLDQAEGLLALTQAGDVSAAERALLRLQGALGAELEPQRQRLVTLRAAVEAGLDFLDEDDVSFASPQDIRVALEQCLAVVERWRTAAQSVGHQPVVCLVGHANAGKSALFNALSGERALVSEQAGTTRDWLEADWTLAERRVRLIDTAGWLDTQEAGIDATAIAAGRRCLEGAAVILACSAPDAPLGEALPIDARTMVIATKADLGQVDAQASLSVSSFDKESVVRLRAAIAERLGAVGSGDPRQQAVLTRVAQRLRELLAELPPEELLADDLRQLADDLGELIGVSTPDNVLEQIFARFCIGK